MEFIIKTGKIRRRAGDAAFGAAEAAKGGAQLVGRSAEGVLARARLEKELRELQAELDSQMQILGELTYAVHRGESDRGLEETLAYVDSLREDLDDCRQRLDAMRGALICAVCGASNDSANLYCASCGAALSAR